MKKNILLFFPFIALFVIYSIIAFVIGNPATALFWISYLLNILSLVAVLLCVGIFSQKLNYYTKMLTLTLVVVVSASFFIIQCIISIIFISFGNIDLGLPVLFELCLLILYSIAIVFLVIYKKNVRTMIENDNEQKKYNTFKSALQKEVEMLQSTKHSMLIDDKLNKLSENVKYETEPISIEESGEIENNIIEKIYVLKISLKENNEGKSLSTLDEIFSMLNQRNVICRNGRG